MVDVNIKHIEDSVGNIGTLQVCVETGNDAQTGHRMWAGKDGAGDTYKFLGKGKPAYIQNLNIADFATAGLLRTDSSGTIYGDVNTLGELNTALGGTTIDESTDTRDPSAHALGGSAHTSATLAQLNALVSDATLDDSSSTRTPTAHALGGASHTSATLAQLNALVSDGTLDTTSDTRAPTAHAGSHEAGGADEINAGDMTGTGAIGDAFEISDAITGNPSAKIEQRSLTEIYAGDVVAGELCGYFSRSIATEKYVFALSQNSGGLLLQWDRFTGVYLGSTTASKGGQGALIFNDDYVAQLYTSNIRRYDQDDISQSDTVTATGLLFPYGDAALDSSGDAYAVGYIDPDSILQKVEDPFSDSPSVTTVRAITETGAWGDWIRSICVSSDDNYIFASSSNGADTVLKLVKSDGTVSASNTFTVASSSFNPSLKCETDHLKIIHGNIVGRLSLSDLSTIDSWAVPSLDTPNGSFYDGVFYDVAYDTTPQAQLKSYQFPSLTIQSPAHSDRSLQNSSSVAELRHETTGERIYHSDSDFQRAAIQAAAHDEYRLMYDVIESVQSTDTKITNAAPGERYLILELSSSYPLHNYVFEMRSDGPRYTAPRVNDLMTIRSSNYLLKFSGTAWEAVGILSRTDEIDLTDAGDTTLHYHAADRNRTNHTGTQTASTISDFDTEVSNNTDVTANTAARHSHATIRPVSSTDEIGLADRNNTVHVTDARTADVGLAVNSAVLALDGFEFNVLVDYHATYTASLYAPVAAAVWEMNGASTVIGNRTLGYKYIIEGGVPVPFGTMPTAVDNSV